MGMAKEVPLPDTSQNLISTNFRGVEVLFCIAQSMQQQRLGLLCLIQQYARNILIFQ